MLIKKRLKRNGVEFIRLQKNLNTDKTFCDMCSKNESCESTYVRNYINRLETVLDVCLDIEWKIKLLKTTSLYGYVFFKFN